jgi:hypothetical protein
LYRDNHDRLVKEFSYRELSQCYGHFRHNFKEQLLKPSAENNHLINYDLSLKNYLMLNGTVHMILSGIYTYTFKHFFGNAIDKQLVNFLGTKKGYYA